MATNISPFIQEIDLRQELIDLFTGNEFVNKMKELILRDSRKDSNGKKIKCHCYNTQTNEGKSDCPDCFGAGYLWDEKLIVGYMWMPREIVMTKSNSFNSINGKLGRSMNSEWMLIVPYSINVSERDIIYTPIVNNEGRIKFPIVPDKTFYVSETARMGFDFGRRDFTAIGLSIR
nr:MAG TPA: hypothetical protein [Caudoviricetes sp.]